MIQIALEQQRPVRPQVILHRPKRFSYLLHAGRFAAGMQVGAVEGDSNMISLLVLGAREEDLFVEKEGGALLEMLVNGSIDLLAYEEISAFDQLEWLGADAEDYEVVYVLGVYDRYYAFIHPKPMHGILTEVIDGEQ